MIIDSCRHSSFQQTLHRLDLVLERLIWAGLTCKMSKCLFFATSAEHLGHVVSREGPRMDPKKVEEWKPSRISKIEPTQINSIEAVRSFLGLCSYYRRFIRRFAIRAAPSTALTRRGCDVPVESQTEAYRKAPGYPLSTRSQTSYL